MHIGTHVGCAIEMHASFPRQDWDMQEKMRKFVDLGLHSPMPSTQLLSLHGLLYLLAQPGDAAAPLLPSATDYLARHLDDSTL